MRRPPIAPDTIDTAAALVVPERQVLAENSRRGTQYTGITHEAFGICGRAGFNPAESDDSLYFAVWRRERLVLDKPPPGAKREKFLYGL